MHIPQALSLDQNNVTLRLTTHICFLFGINKNISDFFVVDSEASMHMSSKKDFTSTEAELSISRSAMTVVTVNEEVQTNEEAKV